MVNSVLSKTRTFSHLIQNCDSSDMIIDKLLNELKEVSESTVVLIDKKGEVIFEELVDTQSLVFKSNDSGQARFIEGQLNTQFGRILETKENISLKDYSIKFLEQAGTEDYTGLIVPVNVLGKRLATLILYKQDGSFDLDSIVLAEQAAIIVGIVIYNTEREKSASAERSVSVVKSAMSTLSYSELEAVLYVFSELDGTEGLLVASKIADKAGITRSVIVNALRKFESAGVIESRSLGMKGTFIKVLNNHLMDELNKLRK